VMQVVPDQENGHASLLLRLHNLGRLQPTVRLPAIRAPRRHLAGSRSTKKPRCFHRGREVETESRA
jgi:hypothetical protein